MTLMGYTIGRHSNNDIKRLYNRKTYSNNDIKGLHNRKTQ